MRMSSKFSKIGLSAICTCALTFSIISIAYEDKEYKCANAMTYFRIEDNYMQINSELVGGGISSGDIQVEMYNIKVDGKLGYEEVNDYVSYDDFYFANCIDDFSGVGNKPSEKSISKVENSLHIIVKPVIGTTSWKLDIPYYIRAFTYDVYYQNYRIGLGLQCESDLSGAYKPSNTYYTKTTTTSYSLESRGSASTKTYVYLDAVSFVYAPQKYGNPVASITQWASSRVAGINYTNRQKFTITADSTYAANVFASCTSDKTGGPEIKVSDNLIYGYFYDPNIKLARENDGSDAITTYTITYGTKSSTASGFANKFNADLCEICNTTQTTGYSDTLGSKWVELSGNGTNCWESLSDNDKNIVKTSSDSLYVNCRAKYDYILRKYNSGHPSTIIDFMGLYTNSTIPSLSAVNVYGTINEDNNTVLIIIVISTSLLVLSSVATLVIIKKRKHQ